MKFISYIFAQFSFGCDDTRQEQRVSMGLGREACPRRRQEQRRWQGLFAVSLLARGLKKNLEKDPVWSQLQATSKTLAGFFVKAHVALNLVVANVCYCTDSNVFLSMTSFARVSSSLPKGNSPPKRTKSTKKTTSKT